jgi:MoaA/NifB/PqqE/SkfB family radical SAM enzyme
MLRTRHLRMAGHFLRHRFAELHPFEVQAILLNACNLKCSYCRCPEIKTELMTTRQWLETLEGLAALGTLRIKFQGGEPTLRRDFKELCAASRRLGLLTAVVTNGSRLVEQPDLFDELDEVVVSLDGPVADLHDKHRGAGTHAIAVEALRLARSNGRPAFAVMVATRESYASVEATLDFCEAMDVGLHVQPVLFGRDKFDDSSRNEIELEASQIRDLHRRLAGWKRAGRRLMFSADVYERVTAWPDYTVLTTTSSGRSDCMAGRFYVHIEANGDVWPCVQHGADFSPGNIVKDGLEGALRQAQTHNCGDCFTAYLNERKDAFGLKPRALLEVFRRG